MEFINILSSDFYELVEIKMVDNPELSFIEAYRLVKDDVLMKQLNTGDGQVDGFNYVDLALPSGTKWATCNVGADLATSDGLLFQFGRTDGYAYGDTNNTFSTADENKNITGNKFINPTTSGTEYAAGQILSLSDDMAHVNMGGDWLMPTREDLEELYDNTTCHEVTINGKQGMLFTSNINGKSIFIVFTGYWNYFDGQFYEGGTFAGIWSSEVKSDNPGWACCIEIIDSGGNLQINHRAYGYSVRGVLKPQINL